jgi:hypothetical protein
METRGVEHICAGLLEGLEPAERVIEIGTVPEEVLATGGEDEIVRELPSSLDCCLYSFDSQAELEERIIFAAGMILD